MHTQRVTQGNSRHSDHGFPSQGRISISHPNSSKKQPGNTKMRTTAPAAQAAPAVGCSHHSSRRHYWMGTRIANGASSLFQARQYYMPTVPRRPPISRLTQPSLAQPVVDTIIMDNNLWLTQPSLTQPLAPCDWRLLAANKTGLRIYMHASNCCWGGGPCKCCHGLHLFALRSRSDMHAALTRKARGGGPTTTVGILVA